jgi:glutamate racemase
LARSGRADAELPLALRTATGFVMGVVQAQLTRPVVGATDPDIERAQALSPERHLKLIEIAKAASRLGSEREFRAGLDIVMAGLTAS